MNEDELEAWRANPLTERFLNLLARSVRVHKAMILEEHWKGGQPSPEWQAQVKASQKILNTLGKMTFDELNEWSDEIAEFERNTANQL